MEKNRKFSEYLKNSVYQKYICQFLVAAGAISFFFILYRFESISVIFNKIFSILQPINIGLVIAYLINPVVRYWERKIVKLIERINKKKVRIKNVKKFARGCSIALSLIMTMAIIIGLFLIVVPELFKSISGLIKDVPSRMDKFSVWITQMLEQYNLNDEMIAAGLNDVFQKVEDWFVTDFSSVVNKFAMSFTSGVFSAFNIILNSMIGIIVSAYILSGKERFALMFKKILYAFFSDTTARGIIESLKSSDKVFGGFISGKIIDSLIIGLLCFIFMSIVNMPYTLIVSVVVGVTNVIPFFGPYIGGIPSAILILIENPLMGVYFTIFIIILQQFDGNILGPKIIGESTGLTAFWVVFAILLGGGLFGMIGLLAGVPTFAVIYGFVKRVVEQRLKEKEINIYEK